MIQRMGRKLEYFRPSWNEKLWGGGYNCFKEQKISSACLMQRITFNLVLICPKKRKYRDFSDPRLYDDYDICSGLGHICAKDHEYR